MSAFSFAPSAPSAPRTGLRLPLRTRSSFRTSLRCVALGLSLCMGTSSLPAMAAASTSTQDAPAAAPAAEAAKTGGRVAILRFTGDKDASSLLRSTTASVLEGLGFETGGVRVSIEDAAKKNKCDLTSEDCLRKIGAYVNKNAKVPFNFYVFADMQAATPTATPSHYLMYDIDKGAIVADIVATPTPNDLNLVNAMAMTLMQKAQRYQTPLPPLSAEERAALDNPGDPEKTAEEAAEEQRILAESEKTKAQTAKAAAVSRVDDIDLKRDFKEFCRTGPRQDTEVRDVENNVTKERDYRPVCKRGPFFGYWQPRSFVLAGATGVGVLAALGLYGMSMAARSDYKKASDEFSSKFGTSTDAKSLVEQQNDLFKNASCDASNHAECYVNLAGKVSETGYKVRRMAMYGDIALGVSVVLAGITAISVFQDRNDAKKYLREQRALKLTNLRVAPVMGGRFYGAAASLRF